MGLETQQVITVNIFDKTKPLCASVLQQIHNLQIQYSSMNNLIFTTGKTLTRLLSTDRFRQLVRNSRTKLYKAHIPVLTTKNQRRRCQYCNMCKVLQKPRTDYIAFPLSSILYWYPLNPAVFQTLCSWWPCSVPPPATPNRPNPSLEELFIRDRRRITRSLAFTPSDISE